MKILFVCSGNTCRSPMAEGLFRSISPGHFCASAGLAATPGLPPSEHALECCRELGVDISAHRSRMVDSASLESWDHIFPMTCDQSVALLSAGALPETIYAPPNIPDPYGGTLQDYRACRDMLLGELRTLALRLEGVRVVPMEPRHLEEIVAIERASFSMPWSLDSFRDELKNPNAVYRVAEKDGHVVAYAGMRKAAGDFYMDNIAVSPDFRRRGAGRMILAHMLRYVRFWEGNFLSLEVRASNAPAIALYEQLGFRREGLRRCFYELPREDGLIYTYRFEEEEKC